MKQDEALMDFVVFYWVSQGDKRHALSERLCAKDKASVVEMVMEKLNKRFFDFDSETEGHVVLQSAHVQYVEIESGSGGCGASDMPEGFVFPN